MKEYKEDFRNVPFGNSVFQITNFTDGQESPARRYRHCLLQLHGKERTLKECEFRRRKINIDIAELKEKISKKSEGTFKRQRLELKLEKKEFGLDAEIKLIEDCVVEVATYRALLKDLPKFTREEFEENEYVYWEKRLLGDARREITSNGTVSPGVMSSLERMGITVGRNEKGQIAYSKEKVNDFLRINEANTNKEQITDSKGDVKL